jgi:hypothetical protein
MAKLTRCNSFGELKSAPLENPLTPAERDRVYAELEEFIRILREPMATRKKEAGSSSETMSAEQEEVESASESLREEYKSDEELTALTQLDAEPFQKPRLGADYTINPELDGKYDNDPCFQGKVNRTNELLKRVGVPKFPERPE